MGMVGSVIMSSSIAAGMTPAIREDTAHTVNNRKPYSAGG